MFVNDLGALCNVQVSDSRGVRKERDRESQEEGEGESESIFSQVTVNVRKAKPWCGDMVPVEARERKVVNEAPNRQRVPQAGACQVGKLGSRRRPSLGFVLKLLPDLLSVSFGT